MSATKYPEKFVVKYPEFDFTWDVSQDVSGKFWTWIDTDTNANIGNFSEAQMDAFKCGGYEFIFPEQAPQEPSLVFPFTYHPARSDGDSFEVTQDDKGDLWWEDLENDGWHSTTSNLFSRDEVKARIKSGEWVVTSVGEQKPVEPPSSRYDSESTHTLKMNTTQATEAMNTLAEAAERVNMALLAMQDIMAGMGLTGQACKGPEFDDLFKFDIS